MPYNLSGACLVPTDDDTFYVMGGMSDEGGAYKYLTYVLQYSVSHMSYDHEHHQAYSLTSLMKRASLRSAALIKLGSLSLACVIFLPPWSPSLPPWPYFLPT